MSVELLTLVVLAVLTAIAIITAVLSFRRRPADTRSWWSDYWQGISSEMVGAIITALLFTFIIGSAEQSAAEASQKEELIQRVGSRVNILALQAAEELDAKGWLTDGTLQEAILQEANLQEARLNGADMQRADLSGANLNRARLLDANLNGANLVRANLSGATLFNTILDGATLEGADLDGANLLGAEFTRNVTLPDGTMWMPDTDMRRFTSSSHEYFWRSDNPDSPAYGGESSG